VRHRPQGCPLRDLTGGSTRAPRHHPGDRAGAHRVPADLVVRPPLDRAEAARLRHPDPVVRGPAALRHPGRGGGLLRQGPVGVPALPGRTRAAGPAGDPHPPPDAGPARPGLGPGGGGRVPAPGLGRPADGPAATSRGVADAHHRHHDRGRALRPRPARPPRPGHGPGRAGGRGAVPGRGRGRGAALGRGRLRGCGDPGGAVDSRRHPFRRTARLPLRGAWQRRARPWRARVRGGAARPPGTV
jgi:hypothetical protein